MPAQIFLVQSMAKIIFAACFILFVLKAQKNLANTQYLLYFVALYGLYLTAEIALLLQWFKRVN
ncbi:MAG: hypothetical protein NT150_14420 [Bacteroidetes bacterium]|nr:hypothetical protein [Bacteroidota bacterium]